MSSTGKKVAIIGGGVAGLLAAVTAADHGAKVLLFEKMDKVGLKMGITGKGRCNLTNNAPIMDFIAMTPGNGRFLFSAYKRFNNMDLLSLFHTWGLETKVERGGRIFPASDDAQEVRHLFMRLLHEKQVDVHLSEPVLHIQTKKGCAAGVVTGKGTYEVDAVILATGGKSYPRTGSTGDGYRLAGELGHTVTKIRPALIPLVCAEPYCRELQGLSLKNVTLALVAGGRRKSEAFGEMIFTHFGISGPIVLTQSDVVTLWLSQGYQVTGYIDLKPALTEEVLDQRILRDLQKFRLKQMGNALSELLPRRLIDAVMKLADIPAEIPAAALKKAQRIHLRQTIKKLPLTITKARPIEEAIVTAGGISTKEVNSSTMESKIVRGLYLAGEVLDVHAFTGGYNLQAAFSMGRMAALSAAGDKTQMRKLAIAIDGPAGAGKSSVAKILAANMGYAYLDTGAMYRAVTYEVLRRELTEEKDIVALAAGMDMTVKPEADAMHVVVNGHDVTDYIRTPEVSARVSAVSALAGVRAAMVGIQRRQAAKGGIVLDGRDIGTTVLPHADVKIFLTASVHTRALRRFKEMTEKNPGMTLEEVEKDIRKRDWQDSHREVSPLKQAEDAVLLDNSRLTLEETAKAIMEICEKKWEVRRANV